MSDPQRPQRPRPKCSRCGSGMDAWGCVKCGGDMAAFRPKKIDVPPFEPGYGRVDLDMLHRVLDMLDRDEQPEYIRSILAQYIVNRPDDRPKKEEK